MSAKVPGSNAYWDRSRPGALWRWILRRASDNGPGLSRWQFWIWWSRPRTLRERLAAIQLLLMAPVRTAVAAFRLVRASGHELQRTRGISPARQFVDMLALWGRTRLPPAAYYKFQLYLPERRARASDFVEDATKPLQVVARTVVATPDDAIFADKSAFEAWCLKHELPCVMTLMEFAEGRVVRRAANGLPPVSLFSKPTNQRAGMGTSLWHHDPGEGTSCWSDGEARSLDADALEAWLAALSKEQGRPYLLQICLRNHPAIQSMGNGGLSTVRMMTVRSDSGKGVTPMLAVLRIPVGDSVADNFDAGGIAVPLDLANGGCGEGVRKRGGTRWNSSSGTPIPAGR